MSSADHWLEHLWRMVENQPQGLDVNQQQQRHETGLVYVQTMELYNSLIRITRSFGKSDKYFKISNIFERQKEK